MSEKRFVLETVAVREKVITDTEKGYSYEDLDEIVDKLNEQQATINRLQRKCFELEKDYLIETSDISDKIYLEDEIKELKKEYGVIDDE